ncbi:MAG: hypothetical protein EBZ74_08615 [Planctomycetia bacterium]|nr:hypothetical protein [Planctomycetia bacterium]
MGYFDGLGDYNNTTGVQPASSNTTNGNSAKWQNGNSYSEQNGNTVTSAKGNSDSFRRGYSNSLVEGVSFSTTLGASYSTIVGFNLPTTGGGKIEHIVPFSLKQTLGVWDADIKGVLVQNKVNNGTVFDWNKSTTYESKTGTHYKLKPSGDQDFASKMQKYVGTENNVIQVLNQTIAQNVMRLGERIEQVGSDTKTVAGTHSITATTHTLTSTMGSSVRMGTFISMSGSMLSFAGEVIQLG